MGGRVYHETHMAPLLRMQGAVREIALDVVRRDGSVLPCLLNAVEVRDATGAPVLVRATLFEATARRRYERELLAAQRSAEESEARSRTLQRVVSDLAAATSVEEVAAVIVARGREATLARCAALVVVEEPEPGAPDALPELRVLRSEGMPPQLMLALQEAAGERLALELAEGVRTVRLDDRLRESRPGVASAMTADGLSALTFVPVTADHRRLGLLLIGTGSPRPGELISLDDPTWVGARTRRRSICSGPWAGRPARRWSGPGCTRRRPGRPSGPAFLLEAARMLAEAADVAETVDRLAELAVSRLADVCAVDLVDRAGAEPGPRCDTATPVGSTSSRSCAPGTCRTGSPHPSVRALETGRHAVGPHGRRRVPAVHHRRPEHLAVARGLELTGLVAVPLTAEGRRLGVLTLGVDRRRGAVHRGRRRGRRAARPAGLPRRRQGAALRARRPHVAHAAGQPAAAAAAGGRRAVDGGAVPGRDAGRGGRRRLLRRRRRCPDEHVALAVGDVVGHDLTAAATMGQLTSVYRALLVERPSPSALIDRLQACWPLLGLQRMATALFAELDPATGQLRIASAGHLPPLLLTDGHAELLPVQPSRMLGAPPARRRRWSGPACCRSGRRWCCSPTGWWRAARPTSTRAWPGCWPRRRRRHLRPRRALRPPAGRADRRAPRRRHRPARADPALAANPSRTGACRGTMGVRDSEQEAAWTLR